MEFLIFIVVLIMFFVSFLGFLCLLINPSYLDKDISFKKGKTSKN